MTRPFACVVVAGAVAAALPFAAGAHAAAAGLAALQSQAQAVARGADHVTATTLNRWIVEDRHDFALIDLRSAADYHAGHIKGAENLSVARLLDGAEIAKLRPLRAVVLYADGFDRAAQAALLLRLAGVRALSLAGGFVYWAEHTMNLPAATGGSEAPSAAVRAAIIRALNNCPRVPQAKIPPLHPVATTPAPAPAVKPGAAGKRQTSAPAKPAKPAAPKSKVPIILQGACG